jgi:membrane fusion protein, multidrug efflux system
MDEKSQNTNSNQNPAPKKRGMAYLIGILLVLLVGGLIIFLTVSRNSSEKKQTEQLTKDAALGPVVQTGSVIVSPQEDSVQVEGDALPYASATIYAKISGYLHSIRVDKGDHVSEGQLLATIESPETDKQYLAAVATMQNDSQIAVRDLALYKKALLSQQDYEQAVFTAEQAKQTADQYKALKSYEEIRAPFAGTVTARYADPGALVQDAEDAASSSLPLVSIADVDKLRIELYMDQRYAPYIHNGDTVRITLPDRPGFSEKVTITRFTGELDVQSRMLLAEAETPNKNNEIVAGSTVHAEVRVKHPRLLQIPVAALIVKGNKDFVGEVVNGNTLQLDSVKIGTNYGSTIEVISGLTGNEKLALNVGNTLPDGAHVQLMKQPGAQPATSADSNHSDSNRSVSK